MVAGRLQIRIRPAEQGHELAHVHVWTPDGGAVIFLEGDHEPVYRPSFRRSDLAAAKRLVAEHYELLMAEWERLRPR